MSANKSNMPSVCSHCGESITSSSVYYRRHYKGYCLKSKQKNIQRENCERKKLAQVMDRKQIEIELHSQSNNFGASENIEDDPYSCSKDNSTVDSQLEDSNSVDENLSSPSIISDFSDTNESFEKDEDTDIEVNVWEDNIPREEFENENNDFVNNTMTKLLNMILAWQLSYYISTGAVEKLLKILSNFMICLESICSCALVTNIAQVFPTSMKAVFKILSLQANDFTKAVTCSSCSSIYNYRELSDEQGNLPSRKCSHISFPNHPQRKYRMPCNTDLMKSFISVDGSRQFFYPKSIYCYRSIKKSLGDLLKNPNFVTLLHSDQYRDSSGHYTDIVDGNVFKTFKDENGHLFFSDKRNLGAIINIDWFNPFKNQQYSMGIIYMAFVNLPRSQRFKWENVVIMSVIPGPKEPKFNVNSFLEPIVCELQEFWRGVALYELGKLALYRLAIICVSSDIPATRKLCGFKSHNAIKGCSKCLCSFNREEASSPNYAVFDETQFIPRDDVQHKLLGAQSEEFNTKDATSKFEKEHGVRYSSLFKLDYFMPVTMHVIDPMHTLLLGVSKHVFITWIDQGILNNQTLEKIDKNLQKVQLPSDIGRLSSSMSRNYKCMKADEWKHWTLIYSIFSLKDVIERKYLVNWVFFVRACYIICQRSVTEAEIDFAHSLLKAFCTGFVELYGYSACVPNMHLMLHIKDCVKNFGSVYSFWCFSFERFNGIMGSYKTNNHSIEVQVMKKFILKSQLFEFSDDNAESENVTFSNSALQRKLFEIASLSLSDIDFSLETPLSTSCLHTLCPEYIESIKSFFDSLCNSDTSIRVSLFARRYKRISMNNEVFAAHDYRKGSSRNCFISARTGNHDKECRPGILKDIFSVKIFLESSQHITEREYFMCRVAFFKEHPDRKKYGVHSPIEIWQISMQDYTPFIPIKFIKRRVAVIKETISLPGILRNSTDVVHAIIPLPTKSIL